MKVDRLSLSLSVCVCVCVCLSGAFSNMTFTVMFSLARLHYVPTPLSPPACHVNVNYILGVIKSSLSAFLFFPVSFFVVNC